MKSAPAPADKNIHQERSLRYSKFSSQPCMKYQDVGTAKHSEMRIRLTKSFDSICHTLSTDAPSTLRTPISLVLCAATKEARPNNPRQEIRMVSPAKRPDSVAVRLVSSNFSA